MDNVTLDLKALCESLALTVKDAGRIILDAHDVENIGGVSEKGTAANLVTKYDVAVQDKLICEVKRLVPEAEFISEEKENDINLLYHPYLFVIDPIDGTANFVHGYRHSCISLAMLSGGETVVAIVYDPYQDEIFTAVKGGGAFLNGKRISVTEREPQYAIYTFGSSPYYKEELGEKSFELAKRLFYDFADLRRGGAAALDLAYLAAGRIDLFYEVRLSPWDYAAGMLLVTEAGGVVSNMKGGPLGLGAPDSVMAATKTSYRAAIKIVKEVI